MVSAPPRRISVFGATGSVGRSTLDVIRRHPGRYHIVALTANRDAAGLAALAREFNAELAVVADPAAHAALQAALAGTRLRTAAGRDGLLQAAALPADWTMAAIVGAAGLEPTLAAVQRGGHIALANKECLVCAGPLLLREAARAGAVLLPVDSEHNAAFQIFAAPHRGAVRRLLLTASGGPFRGFDAARLAAVTPQQALRHPVWKMGAKISIDSATMVNKALELMEAHFLFDLAADDIDILVHPQSAVHCLVEYIDGSVLAHMAAPDMRIPIRHALAWPQRMTDDAVERLDLTRLARLDFQAPDDVLFPAPVLARRALAAGDAARIAFNAANEAAVAAFLDGRLAFPGIARLIEQVLARTAAADAPTLQAVLRQDLAARALAAELLAAGRG